MVFDKLTDLPELVREFTYRYPVQVIAVVPRYPENDGRVGGPPIKYGQRLAWDPPDPGGATIGGM